MDKERPIVHRMTRHEIGHALVATVMFSHSGLIEPVERLSIIPRGKDPTQTTYNRRSDEEYMFPTRARLLERVQVRFPFPNPLPPSPSFVCPLNPNPPSLTN
jgi:hypothetical protein